MQMKKVWEYINNTLMGFRGCFSREATFNWFIIATLGMMLRSDHLGVSSVIREFQINSDLYYLCLLHFFHSNAWKLADLQRTWLETVQASGTIFNVFGKPLLIGDGINDYNSYCTSSCLF